MYFISGFYLSTKVGSSGRSVLASGGGVTGTIRVVPVHVRRTLQTGTRKALKIGNYYVSMDNWSHWLRM